MRRTLKNVLNYKKTPEYREEARNQLIRGGARYKTICEVFRLLYDEIHDKRWKNKDKMIELMIDGIIMGKSMHSRLKYYQRKYNDVTGKRGNNLEYLIGAIERKRKRAKRII